MATKKSTPTDEKFQSTDLDLFEVLAALDRKDYQFYDRLSEEQKKKFVPFMMTHWMSAIKGNEGVQRYYVMSTDYNANKYLFNEYVQKHPKLQWYMLCAASPGLGKQFHQWIPHIKDKVAKLKENAKLKDVKEYFTKVYTKADSETVKELSETYVVDQHRKVMLGKMFPNMKLSDIEVLNTLVTDEEIEEYERDSGNK